MGSSTADNLRRRRQERGLTQEQLAVYAGVTRTTVARIEAGKGAYRGTFALLAAALECEIHDLIAEEPLPA
jgi:transcriptional regulator with XRE-family HTH domain